MEPMGGDFVGEKGYEMLEGCSSRFIKKRSRKVLEDGEGKEY